MIYARKKLTAKRGNAARVRFTNFSGGLSKEVDEGILPLRYATVAYNCRSSDGALKNGAGAERFSVQPPRAVVRAFYYRRFDHDKGVFDDRLLVFCEDGKIYWIKLPGRIGCTAFLSAALNPRRLMVAATSTPRNAFDVQPKFCPKEGTHSSKLKKIRIKTAPDISKF